MTGRGAGDRFAVKRAALGDQCRIPFVRFYAAASTRSPRPRIPERPMVKPRLFVAVLVLQSRISTQDENPIVDHQVHLIRAPNAKSAHARALRIGEDENGTYRD